MRTLILLTLMAASAAPYSPSVYPSLAQRTRDCGPAYACEDAYYMCMSMALNTCAKRFRPEDYRYDICLTQEQQKCTR
jgi:hypothetical protein